MTEERFEIFHIALITLANIFQKSFENGSHKLQMLLPVGKVAGI